MSLKSFQPVWKISRQCGKFPDSLESLQQNEKFPDSLEYVFFSFENQTSPDVVPFMRCPATWQNGAVTLHEKLHYSQRDCMT